MASKPPARNPKKTSSRPLLVIAIILCLAVILVFWSQHREGAVAPEASLPADASSQPAPADSGTQPQVLSQGESLVIPRSDLSSTATFYPVEVDGTQMEILAVVDEEGTVRTAFNTCQVCYSSGRGYYVQEGNQLVCQNCGNRFTVDQVEVQTGGCNPWPIFPENKTVTEDTIEISYDFLAESSAIFANWKAQV